MPWRGPEYPGEFPTLGYQVAEWVEEMCVVPDGDHAGEPFRLTDEQLRWYLWHYRLRPDATVARKSMAWQFPRGSMLVRPQKWGKGPLSASYTCVEAEGPVVFDGWDANGEPVGRPWATPWIQITAVSEDQTDNVYRSLVPMIQLGPLADLIPDTGETRINLRGGGRIEPVTASATSRLGQRITAVVQDEPHSWTDRNGGRRLADNQRRNLAGMGGRFMATTNAWNPAELSVAQLTAENPTGVHIDYPQPPAGSVRNKRERRKVMRVVYGDSLIERGGWVDLDRIDVEVEALLKIDPAQAERFFMNRAQAGESVAFDLAAWKDRARPGLVIPDGELVVVGVDGARFQDALAIVATDVESGHQWPVHIAERPENAPDEYEHDFELADGAMLDLFERYQVWRVYVDPEKIEGLVDRWQARWGDDVVLPWWMNRPRQVGYAMRAYREAMVSKASPLTHDGDVTLTRHIGNAHKMPLTVKDDEGRPMWSVQKERPGSPNKIDGAAAGVISWEARGDAIAAGAKKKRRKIAAGF